MIQYLWFIIVSQIQPLFQDYNIPLAKSDFSLFVNPDDNVANRFDIIKYEKLETTQPDLLRQKQYWQECVEGFDWLKNKIMLGRIDIDKMIQQEIIDRYGYNFDKNNPNSYYAFKNFLRANILNKMDSNRSIYEKESNHTLQKKLSDYYQPSTRKKLKSFINNKV